MKAAIESSAAGWLKPFECRQHCGDIVTPKTEHLRTSSHLKVAK